MTERKRTRTPVPVQCPNNEGIGCLHPDCCGKCGWNPEVARARMEKILKELGVEVK